MPAEQPKKAAKAEVVADVPVVEMVEQPQQDRMFRRRRTRTE